MRRKIHIKVSAILVGMIGMIGRLMYTIKSNEYHQNHQVHVHVHVQKSPRRCENQDSKVMIIAGAPLPPRDSFMWSLT